MTWPRCNSLGHRPENSCFAGRIVLSHVHASTLRRTQSLPKTWQCDELSARRSMNFLADGPASCSVARSHHVYRGSLSASPCRQNPRCGVRKVRPTRRSQPKSPASSNMTCPSSPIDSSTRVPRPPPELKVFLKNVPKLLRWPGQWK